MDGCQEQQRVKGYCMYHYRRTRPACSVEGCESVQIGGGMCSRHYRRVRLYGDAGTALRSPWGSTGWERLEHFVERGEPDECWDFKGCLKAGYGVVLINHVQHQAHRLAYVATYGPVPEGLEIDHLCRNKRCVNPAHLEAVTRSQNMRRRFRMTDREHLNARGRMV